MFTPKGITHVIGGAAGNVSCGLTALGCEVRFGSVVGRDRTGILILEGLKALGISTQFVRQDWPESSRTVILVDAQGNRLCINDPKYANSYRYPESEIDAGIGDSKYVFVSTQDWCRHVARYANKKGRRVAVDVQAIVIDDEYHRDFLRNAELVILSTERLSMHSHDFIRKLWADYDVETVVATHGKDGATLGIRREGRIYYEPCHHIRPVIDLTGAGDAFAAGFMCAKLQKEHDRTALTVGQLTAAYKIGEKGSTRGFPAYKTIRDLLEKPDM